MTELRIAIKNTSADGGTFLTPTYFGFHNGDFDLFNMGEAASPGLESLAEDGSAALLAQERLASSPGSQGIVVTGAAGPIATQEQTSAIIDINGALNTSVSFGAMLLPSNDAFIGTDQALTLFDANGRFLGAQEVVFEGSDVYDAGTEVNTELDAAFLNQAGPNEGETEGGVVTLHPGFNGSLGNPVGEGDQNILGGTNAFGVAIDEEAADFTQPGATIATVHINTVVTRNGGDGRDFILGGRDDDLISAGDGKDLIFGRSGWDVIDGEGGNDKIFGGRGNDEISGGDGHDWIAGGRDDDIIDGGAGRDDIRGGRGDDQIGGGDGDDWISGGRGNDLIAGGRGDDYLRGGSGDDTFLFATGDGDDYVRDFNRHSDDTLVLAVDGVAGFDDVLDAADQHRRGVELDFGEDSLFLRGVRLSDLSEDDFIFV